MEVFLLMFVYLSQWIKCGLLVGREVRWKDVFSIRKSRTQSFLGKKKWIWWCLSSESYVPILPSTFKTHSPLFACFLFSYCV